MTREIAGLTRERSGGHAGAMSLLLPQTRTGTIKSLQPIDIHGDRYVDVQLELDDSPGQPFLGRISAAECPPDLTAGDRVAARFTMGVIVRLARTR